MEPPSHIDGAKVLQWAWSGDEPFFVMPHADNQPGIPIHGLAICRYEDSDEVYRFSCDDQWECQNDSSWPNIDAAAKGLSGQYDVEATSWKQRGDSESAS